MNMFEWLGVAIALAIVLGVPAMVVFFMVRAVRRHGVRGALRALIVGLGRRKGITLLVAGVIALISVHSIRPPSGFGDALMVMVTSFNRR